LHHTTVRAADLIDVRMVLVIFVSDAMKFSSSGREYRTGGMLARVSNNAVHAMMMFSSFVGIPFCDRTARRIFDLALVQVSSISSAGNGTGCSCC